MPANDAAYAEVTVPAKQLSVQAQVAHPERLVSRPAKQTVTRRAIAQTTSRRRAFFERMVEERGMRAQLRSGSPLTGQLLPLSFLAGLRLYAPF